MTISLPRMAVFPSFCLPDARHRARSCFSCLRSKADTGVWRTESPISTPLHDLEEETFLKCMGIDLEELSSRVTIAKNCIVLYLPQQFCIQLVPAIDLVIIVVWYTQKRCAC